MTDATKLEVSTVIKDGDDLYYLLKVVRRGFDVYCIPPDLGIHYSLHESGEGHFRFEAGTLKVEQEPAIALIEGEAGVIHDRGIIRTPLRDLGRATGICSAILPINDLSGDLRRFNRNLNNCFVIEVALFPRSTEFIQVGVWAVPDRNKVSFEFNNPNIPEGLIYKITCVEPQIWIYAIPLCA